MNEYDVIEREAGRHALEMYAMQEKASKLTGRPVYDRKDLIIENQRAAIRVLIRALDGGDVSEQELQQARSVLK